MATAAYGFTPADFEYKPSAPRGLFDMIAGTSEGQGSDFSSRLGVLAQILASVGTGRAMPDVAGQLGAIDDRNSKRRQQAKAERMVARAAGKIAERDPELAAAMMADTAFGMQMLGKKYESEWSSTQRMKELEREQELLGQRELALQKQKSEAWMSNPMFAGVLERMKGGGTEPVADAAPAPGISDVGSIPAPTQDMSQLQPAPANIPLPGNPDMTGQPLSAQPELQQPQAGQQQPPVGQQPQQQPQSFDPSTVRVEPFPVADDGFTAMLQETFSPIVGVPRISGHAAQAIWAAKDVGGVDLATAIDNAGKEWAAKQAADQGNARKDWEYQRGVADDARKTALANLVSQQEPTRLQNEYMGGVPPQPLVGSPEQIKKMEVLAREGYSKEDTDMLGGVDQLYNQVMAGVRGGVDARATQVAGAGDDIRAARAAKTTADTLAQSGEGVARSAKTMADSIRAIPAQDRTPEDAHDLAILDAAAAVAPVKPDVAGQLMESLSENRRQRADTASLIDTRSRTTKATEDAEARLAKKAEDDAKALEEQEKSRFIRGVSGAKVVQKKVKQIASIMYGKDSAYGTNAYGVKGWLSGKIPGTAQSALNGFIDTIEGQIADRELQAVRNASVGGASGYGQLTEPELKIFQTKLTNLRSAAETGVGLEAALKEVWNDYENMIHPTSGQRFDESAEGFVMREFNFEEDSPGLYEWAKKEGKLDDYMRPDKVPTGQGVYDPQGFGPKDQLRQGLDPQGFGPKPKVGG